MENLKVSLNVPFNSVCARSTHSLIYVTISEFYLVPFICKITNVPNLNCRITVDTSSSSKLSSLLSLYEPGSRGFSLTSHGCSPSTVEPFLIDESKITGESVVQQVIKRLFAQKLLATNWSTLYPVIIWCCPTILLCALSRIWQLSWWTYHVSTRVICGSAVEKVPLVCSICRSNLLYPEEAHQWPAYYCVLVNCYYAFGLTCPQRWLTSKSNNISRLNNEANRVVPPHCSLKHATLENQPLVTQ